MKKISLLAAMLGLVGAGLLVGCDKKEPASTTPEVPSTNAPATPATPSTNAPAAPAP